MNSPGEIRAGVYTRLSHVLMDDKTKVEDQDRIGRELADRLGWEVAGTYTDNNRSAWQRNRKRRDWERMLADVEAGRINAIIVYHGDRLIRQPEDLAALLKLADGKGVKLASPTGTRDLASADDQVILYIEAAMAMRESSNTSRRLKSHHERRRRAGKRPTGGWGGRPFGFETDAMTHRAPDRCDVTNRQLQSEAGIIRKMAARLLAGESLTSVTADYSARGWTMPSGVPLRYDNVRKMLLRPAMAGLMPDGQTAGTWEPILDRPQWERVCIALNARSASMPSWGTTPARRWLLSGIAVCGACAGPMGIRPAKAGPAYSCRNPGCGKVYRLAAHLDAYVSAWVVARLNDPDSPDPQIPAEPGAAAEWAALAREQADTEALLADYRTSAGRARLLMTRLDAIEARIGELREREAGGARSRLLGRYRGITLAEFRGLPLEVRRALVAASCRVTVLPASRRGRGFRTEDVRVEPL